MKSPLHINVVISGNSQKRFRKSFSRTIFPEISRKVQFEKKAKLA
eukprot:UN17209